MDSVKLNVGGKLFTSTKFTLSKEENSLLAHIVNGNVPLETDTEGRIIINRDGTCFRYILNYLRDGELNLPQNNQGLLAKIYEEAQYYNLTSLLELLAVEDDDEDSAEDDSSTTETLFQGEYRVATLTGHQGVVHCLAFAPDSNNKTLITGSGDHSIRFWNTDAVEGLDASPINKSDRHLIHTIDNAHNFSVRCMQMGKKWLVTAGDDEVVKLWDVEKQECITTFTGHTNYIYSICISDDASSSNNTIPGQLIASGSYGVINLWDIISGRLIHTINTHKGHYVSCLQMDFAGRSEPRLVSGSHDGTAKIWSLASLSSSPECLMTLAGHTSQITSMQLQGNRLATASKDRTIKIWGARSGDCLRTLCGHTDSVTCLAFRDNRIISGSLDKTVRIWNARTSDWLTALSGNNITTTSPSNNLFDRSDATRGAKPDASTAPTTESPSSEHHVAPPSTASPVRCIGVRADNRCIACGCEDSTISLWKFLDATTTTTTTTTQQQ